MKKMDINVIKTAILNARTSPFPDTNRVIKEARLNSVAGVVGFVGGAIATAGSALAGAVR